MPQQRKHQWYLVPGFFPRWSADLYMKPHTLKRGPVIVEASDVELSEYGLRICIDPADAIALTLADACIVDD